MYGMYQKKLYVPLCWDSVKKLWSGRPFTSLLPAFYLGGFGGKLPKEIFEIYLWGCFWGPRRLLYIWGGVEIPCLTLYESLHVICTYIRIYTYKLIKDIVLYRITGYLCNPEICTVLEKKGNLWIIFMRGSTWDMAVFTVDIHYANHICTIYHICGI